LNRFRWFSTFSFFRHEKKETIKMTAPNENEQKAILAAGMALGALATLAAVVKAALEQAAKQEGDNTQ
jgi:hypothetical protein